jgi:hypothetical protein
VNVTATDASGNATTKTFNVTVRDTKAPVIIVPKDITVTATGASGAAVTFAATVIDAVDPNPTLAYSAASGSVFAVGTTTVTVTARDAAGNVSTATFKVTVGAPAPPVVTTLPTQSVFAGQVLRVAVPASIPGRPASPLQFALVNPPVGATIDAKTGVLTWTAPTKTGTYTVGVRVTDPTSGLSTTKNVTVLVMAKAVPLPFPRPGVIPGIRF